MKKVLLIDGNSLLFRAYYATAFGENPNILRSSDGTPTNALLALSNIVIKLLNSGDFDYSLIAFDTDAPTLRFQKYEDYKAGRKETPIDLVRQFPLARQMLRNLGFFVYEQPGYEADDIIGSMAKI